MISFSIEDAVPLLIPIDTFNDGVIIFVQFKHEREQIFLLINLQLGRRQPSGPSPSNSILHPAVER